MDKKEVEDKIRTSVVMMFGSDGDEIEPEDRETLICNLVLDFNELLQKQMEEFSKAMAKTLKFNDGDIIIVNDVDLARGLSYSAEQTKAKHVLTIIVKDLNDIKLMTAEEKKVIRDFLSKY